MLTTPRTEGLNNCFLFLITQNVYSTLAPANISVNELADHFNKKCKNVIDAIAPTKVKEVTGKKISPWRKAMTVRTEKKRVLKS